MTDTYKEDQRVRKEGHDAKENSYNRGRDRAVVRFGAGSPTNSGMD